MIASLRDCSTVLGESEEQNKFELPIILVFFWFIQFDDY